MQGIGSDASYRPGGGNAANDVSREQLFFIMIEIWQTLLSHCCIFMFIR